MFKAMYYSKKNKKIKHLLQASIFLKFKFGRQVKKYMKE